MRAVNDVYKSFNTNQVPVAILDLQIPTESVDINVSPDKRTIMVHSEANLIEALRVSPAVVELLTFREGSTTSSSLQDRRTLSAGHRTPSS